MAGKYKTFTSEEQFQDLEKELEQIKLQWKKGTNEEQTSSRSNFRNRFEPVKKMTATEEELREWRVEQRKRRNRKSAKRSRINKQKRRRQLEKESKFWEEKYNGLTSKTTNNNSTSISTSSRVFSSESM